MTVLPFRAPSETRAPGTGPPGGTAEVLGTFQAPDGGRGLFTGAYRLERLLDEHGQLAAAGVFTGELHAADGSHVGTGSRRLTCAAVVGSDSSAYEMRVGPVDVNLLGFMVSVGEFSITMRRNLAPATGSGRGAAQARRQARAGR
jgi:hypothetical protein